MGIRDAFSCVQTSDSNVTILPSRVRSYTNFGLNSLITPIKKGTKIITIFVPFYCGELLFFTLKETLNKSGSTVLYCWKLLYPLFFSCDIAFVILAIRPPHITIIPITIIVIALPVMIKRPPLPALFHFLDQYFFPTLKLRK